MLIRTQLRLAALIPALVSLLIGGVLWVADSEADKARQVAEIAARVRVANFELNILTQEYLLFNGARVEGQLRIRLRSMGDLLAQLGHDGQNPEEKELVETLRRSHQELGGFYNLLFGSSSSSQGQIAGALLVKAQNIRAKSEQFVDIQQVQVVQLQRRAVVVVASSLCVMAGLSVIFLVLLTRKLIRGIGLLEEGVRRIAVGDHEHQIPLDTSSELGLLAQSFNDMSRLLRDSYASIETLLAGSRKLNADLELQRVALEERNADLRQEMEMRRRQEDLVRESNAQLTRQKAELEATLNRIKRLEGLLSICMQCKKIRTENNAWLELEKYIGDNSDATFSHGLCPECLDMEMKKLD